jgi:hypothetical protein
MRVAGSPAEKRSWHRMVRVECAGVCHPAAKFVTICCPGILGLQPVSPPRDSNRYSRTHGRTQDARADCR